MTEALARAGVVAVRVETGSMAPTVSAGDSVLVRARRGVAGEVVLIRTPGAPTLHRLVGRAAGRWVHAGDAPEAWPGLCRDQDILGVADLPARLSPWPVRVALIVLALGRGTLRRVMMS